MEPIRVLTDAQMEQIDDAAGRILERTGLKVDLPEAVEALARFGCQVDHAAGRVRFPRPLTREVVNKMRQDYARPDRPETMPVRFSHVRFRRGPHQVHEDFTVSAGGFVPFICDLDGLRRPANGHDVLCAINMVNHLPQIDLSGLPVSDQTIRADHRPVVMAAQLAKYTRKIGGIETFTRADVLAMHEMAMVLAGSEQEFRRHPRLVGYAEIRSPLCLDRNMAEIFVQYVRLGVPQTVDSMPAGGSTAPMTAAGVLALGAAESIAALALGYAIRDDAVVGLDISPSYTDMSSGLFKYAGADRCRLLMARVQLLSEFYGCPCGVHGGKTDSCFHNEQAAADKMATMLLPVLAGAVGIGTVGCLENAVTFSPVQLAIDNELAAYVRRAVGPLAVNDDTLAVELIDQVGPGGQFLTSDHTADHFRGELFLSPLFPTQPWVTAHADFEQFDTVARAADLARQLWRPPDAPVLSDDQIRAIDRIVRAATGGL